MTNNNDWQIWIVDIRNDNLAIAIKTNFGITSSKE